MIDEEFNPNHCGLCMRLQQEQFPCGSCEDAYKIKGGTKLVDPTVFVSRLKYDPDGYTVMRYAQKRVLEFLKRLLRVA